MTWRNLGLAFRNPIDCGWRPKNKGMEKLVIFFFFFVCFLFVSYFGQHGPAVVAEQQDPPCGLLNIRDICFYFSFVSSHLVSPSSSSSSSASSTTGPNDPAWAIYCPSPLEKEERRVEDRTGEENEGASPPWACCASLVLQRHGSNTLYQTAYRWICGLGINWRVFKGIGVSCHPESSVFSLAFYVSPPSCLSLIIV
jgi:hypothetical protein